MGKSDFLLHFYRSHYDRFRLGFILVLLLVYLVLLVVLVYNKFTIYHQFQNFWIKFNWIEVGPICFWFLQTFTIYSAFFLWSVRNAELFLKQPFFSGVGRVIRSIDIYFQVLALTNRSYYCYVDLLWKGLVTLPEARRIIWSTAQVHGEHLVYTKVAACN